MQHAVILECVAHELGACTVSPPRGPGIVSLPTPEQDLAQFQQEDGFCQDRALASLRLNSEQTAAGGLIGTGAALRLCLGLWTACWGLSSLLVMGSKGAP
jgi:hypothetical protein